MLAVCLHLAVGLGQKIHTVSGYYSIGTDYKREVPVDAKTLEIYCCDLVVMVDLETGEVTDNAKT